MTSQASLGEGPHGFGPFCVLTETTARYWIGTTADLSEHLPCSLGGLAVELMFRVISYRDRGRTTAPAPDRLPWWAVDAIDDLRGT